VYVAVLAVWCEKLGAEPVYKGKSLSQWAILTQWQGLDRQPSAEAREAMDAVRAIGAEGVPYLVKFIQPPWSSSLLPGGAVESLKALGPVAKSAIPDLGRIVNQQPQTMNDESARTEAAIALSYLGPEAVPVLLTAATNAQGQHIQWEIIDDMANFGTNGAAAVPALVAWSRDPDDWVRLGALHALCSVAKSPEVVLPVLAADLKDSSNLVRRDAAESLGALGKGDTNSLPLLLKALNDPDWQVRTGAIGGLGRLGEQRETVLPLIREKLHDENRIIRRCSAFALGDLGGKAAFDALMEATGDGDGFVREAVFKSLREIDPVALQKSGKQFRSRNPVRAPRVLTNDVR
jgi:HEAT repeat protein